MKKIESVAIGMILLSFVASFYFYPQMPEKMASHWNAQGQVDGYMPKSLVLFLMPFIAAGLFLLFIAVPKIDPLRANIEKFRRYYERFVLLVIAFMFYIHVLTIIWNMGMTFNLMQALSPAFGILFYYCGVLIANAKQNWFIGIRTPWTMSSEKVWGKTHRLGGRLFKLSGIIAFFGVLIPDYAILLILVPVILFTVYTVIYSYLEYQREQK
jgi:uncharacterized membrane protein